MCHLARYGLALRTNCAIGARMLLQWVQRICNMGGKLQVTTENAAHILIVLFRRSRESG